ncbi:AMP-binding enzyme [Hymenobacter sp. APR13]|uniref:AMP-binding enzyme n=1 Tax=Hymenobacter sp. APR13 TaxID=1356852 RepID=UPI002934875E|nr:hypothetical protein [Hymenobacter sp. APR13]
MRRAGYCLRAARPGARGSGGAQRWPDPPETQLEQELVALIREQIGAVACFRHAAVVARLPKTRSGKILRKTLRQLADGEDCPIPSTIDDPAILDEIREVLRRRQIGQAFENPAATNQS